MLSKYFALLLLAFSLTVELLRFKQSQIWLSKQLGKNGYQNASAWNIIKGKQIYEVLEALSGLK
jgi:hypothetical protein